MAQSSGPAVSSTHACRSLEGILHQTFVSISSLRDALQMCEAPDSNGDGAAADCWHSREDQKNAVVLREFKKLSELKHRFKWQSVGSASNNRSHAASMTVSEGRPSDPEHSTPASPCHGGACKAATDLRLQLQKRDSEIKNLNATVERLVVKKDKLERRVKRLEERLNKSSVYGGTGLDKCWDRFSGDDFAREPCITPGDGTPKQGNALWKSPRAARHIRKASFGTHNTSNGVVDGHGCNDAVKNLADIRAKSGKLGSKGNPDKPRRRKEMAEPSIDNQGQSELQRWFEASMGEVTDTVLGFSKALILLMRRANWDIEEGGVEWATESHKGLAVQSYVCTHMFHGFENEDFYMSGRLSCLLAPSKHREECRQQFRAMVQMVEEPSDLLAGMAPDSAFGQFCRKKFLQTLPPHMEEALMGDLRHRHCLTQEGAHPYRSRFYQSFVRMAKAVWTIHKLAFSLDQRVGIFRAERGADFAAASMVSHIANLEMASDTNNLLPKVAFTIMPGFRIGENVILKCRVYLNGMKISSPVMNQKDD